MGGSNWSEKAYMDTSALRTTKGIAGRTTEYTDKVAKGQAARAVHEKMNPKGVTYREARDSTAHPESVPVIVQFDVTGSMGHIPVVLQEKLPNLMGMLIKKGYLADPAIMISAVGDAKNDSAPLQIGQFESGIEIDQDLDKLWLERGGGPGTQESYELGMYFVANHTVADHYEKRQKKGYYFIIGDESPYNSVSFKEVHKLIGDTPQDNIPIEQVVTALKEKWHVFVLIPETATAIGYPEIRARWTELFGQNVLLLKDPAAICETIATTIGMLEGRTDLSKATKDMKETGSSDAHTEVVSDALAGLTVGGDSGGGTAVAEPPKKAGKVKRLD